MKRWVVMETVHKFLIALGAAVLHYFGLAQIGEWRDVIPLWEHNESTDFRLPS